MIRGLDAGNGEQAIQKFEVVSGFLIGCRVTLTDVVKIRGESDLFRVKVNDDDVRKSILNKAKQLKKTPSIFV